ncbi:MAG TPA: UPF0182 family protein, partial [Actinomycetota bacterium]|nr:UPF0182 family protein [Actinomycetota bacterium]
TIAILAGLLVLFLIFSSVYTELLWFRSVNFSSVFTTVLSVRLAMFVGFGLLMAVIVGLGMVIAYRTRPDYDPRLSASMEGYRQSVEPIRKWLLLTISGFLGILAGLSATSEWNRWLLFRNGGSFGVQDPQFGMDVGFFVFKLPFLRYLTGFGFMALLLTLLLVVAVHYLYGGVRLQHGMQATEAAQVQMSLLLGLICLLKAVAYWLDRYALSLKDEDFVEGFTGLKYRDVEAVLPAKTILTFIALVCAALFFLNVFRRTWTLPLVGLGLLAVSALVVGGIYPAVVQQFQVRPNEPGKEAPFISRNIQATRDAYNLSNAQNDEYSAVAQPNEESLAADQGTLQNIRIMDPAIVSPTFRQLQQIRTFYSFPDTLDVDRYQLPSGRSGAIVSTREVDLSAVPPAQRNWANDTLVYTHGYGLVASYDNRANSEGEPEFFAEDIPPQGELTMSQPRVYYGEKSPVYSIVGGPGGPREFDFPDDTSPSGQRTNTYDGTGGVPVGSPLNRMMFAAKFSEPNILLSSLIGPDSKILYDRDPLTRVRSVAPWLRVDSDPYPAVVNDRIVWLVDGYTTSDSYPYSARLRWSDATSDSLTVRRQVNLEQDYVNYVRNSVKAVVDAYDGTVTLYAWDASDPILQAWQKSFPGSVQPASEMPAELQAHVRYPEDIFKAQRLVYSRYHVTDPTSFYSGQDFWYVPTDPTDPAAGKPQPPYYLTLRMPDQVSQEFALTTTFSPVRRQTLAAFMSASSEPGPGYGRLRVLQLPRNSVIPGPLQVQNSFESDPEVATQLSLLRRGGSEVQLGNLLSLPVAGGFLYVEPVYVRASQDGYPLLRRVLVSFGTQVAFEHTLSDALAKVLGAQTQPPGQQDGKPHKETPQQRLAKALADADAAMKAADEALRGGDFAAYGKAQKDLEDAIQRAIDAQREIAGGKQTDAEPLPEPSATAQEPAPPPSPDATAAPDATLAPDAA